MRALSCFFVLAMPLVLLTAPALSQTQSVSTPLCVYDSKDYSDGAFICAQRSLMLTCAADGAKATWKIVDDKDVNARCIAPIARSTDQGQRPRYRRTAMRPQIVRQPDPNAKCFNFNGKRYCE